MPEQVALVACGSAKRDTPAPAKALYTSTYFEKKRQYAEQECSDWYILSAKHGLVEPEAVLEPYDASLAPRHDSYIGEDAVRAWRRDVQASLSALVASFDRPASVQVVVLAGADYAEHIEPVLAGAAVQTCFPFRGLGGLPGQMGWLSDRLEVGDQ